VMDNLPLVYRHEPSEEEARPSSIRMLRDSYSVRLN